MERLASHRYDLILCDFSLPGWNGLEALRWVRKSGHDTPFIYVSGTLGEDVAVECIRQGATDYVLKNNLARLPHAVRRSLEEWELRLTKRRIEKEKKDSERQYKLLFESNPAPMWVLERNTLAFLAVNDAAVNNYGYSREEFRNMNALDILPKDEVQDGLRSLLQKDLKRFQVTEHTRHLKKDSTVVEVEVSRNAVSFGDIDAMLVLAHDITEIRRNQERLRHSEEKFAKAFRSSPMAITISTKQDGRYIEVNDAFVRMLDLDRESVIGRSSIELRVWDVLEDRDAMVRELERSGRVTLFETRFNSKSRGVRAVRISAETIMLGDLSCILAIITDVTSAKSLEEQFRQAQKMEAVGRLAGGIAHDFNNMLSVIMGYCDLAQDHRDLDTVGRDVRQIKKAAQRAAKLTGQLLAFSRQQVVRPSILNLNVVVREIFQMLLRVIAADVRLLFEPAENLGNVKADLGQIEQILMNLVMNARDAMSQGGSIVIETANVELDENYSCRHPNVKPGAYVMLSVSDTGHGMDSGTLSKIFEPFFTTKSPGMGTGLGLSMVYGAMEQANGHIVAYSEESKGTTFKLYFPMADGEAQMPSVVNNDVSRIRGFETVLLVEDEADLRGLTKELLESEGYTVLAATDATQAFELVGNHLGLIHILLTDVVLPGMSGRELAERVLESRPGVKVLYMSGYSGALVAKQGVLDPGMALLSKPFSRRELLSQLRSVLDH
jgi:PAS domain S-box-containing protein